MPPLFERAGEGWKEIWRDSKLAWRLRTLSEEEREAWPAQGVFVHGPFQRIHLAPGATLRDASLNTEQGDIVIGPDAEIMEGCRIRGPFALGEGSVLRMGTLVYGPTTVGQGLQSRGRIEQRGRSRLLQQGPRRIFGEFAVLGSWCNLGAETTCSNLKNTYGVIAEWSEDRQWFCRQGTPILRTDHGRPQQNRHPHRVQHGQRGRCDEQCVWGKHATEIFAGLFLGRGRRGARRRATLTKVMARRDKSLTPDEADHPSRL